MTTVKGAVTGPPKIQDLKPLPKRRSDSFIFLRECFRRPLQVASLAPSSKTLQRCLVKMADISSAKTIVELGPGTGGTTQAILRAMAADAQLLSIEINPRLCAVVSSIRDERLISHLGNACDLRKIISSHRLGAPEVVISGIPFSTMDHVSGSGLLDVIVSLLAPEGRFVTYQVSKKVISLSRPFLEPTSMQVRSVLFNTPPLRVLRWDKTVSPQDPSGH